MARHLQEQRNNTISELSTRIFVWLHGNVLELQWAIARSRMLTHRLRNTEFSIRLPLRVFSTVIIPVAERSSFSSFSHDEIFICKKNIFGFIIGMQNSRLYSIISWHWKTMYSTIGSGEILVTFYQPQIVDYSARAGILTWYTCGMILVDPLGPRWGLSGIAARSLILVLDVLHGGHCRGLQVAPVLALEAAHRRSISDGHR